MSKYSSPDLLTVVMQLILKHIWTSGADHKHLLSCLIYIYTHFLIYIILTSAPLDNWYDGNAHFSFPRFFAVTTIADTFVSILGLMTTANSVHTTDGLCEGFMLEG